MTILQKEFAIDEYTKKINLVILILLPLSLLIGSGVINVLIILFNVFFIVEILKKKEIDFFKKKTFYLLLLLWVYLIFNAFIGINFENSLDRSIGFIRFIILSFGINYYFTKYYDYFKNFIFKIWSLFFLIVSIDLLFESIVGFNLLGNVSPDQGRLSGFLGEELKIGNYYFGFLLITLSYLLYRFKNNYILYIFAFAFIIISLLIGERSNFLKVFFITSFFLFFFQNKNYLKKILVFIISLVFLFSIIYSNKNYKNRFWEMLIKPIVVKDLNLIESLKYSPYGAHYDTALKIFNDNKLFGIGLKNFRVESGNPKYRNKEFIFTDARQTTHPHQIHFEILAETGLIGYILFSLFFYLSINNFLKSYKRKKDLFKLSSFLFVVATVIPLLPSGSFFTTYSATIFWINYGFLISEKKY